MTDWSYPPSGRDRGRPGPVEECKMPDFAHGEQTEDQEKLQRSATAVAEAPEQETAAAPVPVGGLLVGSADDPLEAAADRAADAALSKIRRLADPGGPDAHRHGRGCGHVDVQRVAAPTAEPRIGMDGGALDGATNSKIDSMRSSGKPLEAGLRATMETAFGAPLDRLRIHTGPEAAAISRQISAKAFTTGNDIFFGEGQYAPDSKAGAHTLAHEIAHTLQPGGGAHRLVDVIRRDDDDWGTVKGKGAKKAEKKAAKKAASLLTGDAIAAKLALGTAGNYGIGSATAEVTEAAAEAWLGEGQFQTSVGWQSADRTRNYRSPSFKPNLGVTQANFESRAGDKGAWSSNGHVTIEEA